MVEYNAGIDIICYVKVNYQNDSLPPSPYTGEGEQHPRPPGTYVYFYTRFLVENQLKSAFTKGEQYMVYKEGSRTLLRKASKNKRMA